MASFTYTAAINGLHQFAKLWSSLPPTLPQLSLGYRKALQRSFALEVASSFYPVGCRKMTYVGRKVERGWLESSLNTYLEHTWFQSFTLNMFHTVV